MRCKKMSSSCWFFKSLAGAAHAAVFGRER